MAVSNPSMARRLHWRHKSPEAVLARAEEALHKTLYIVHQAGPTSFVLREETGERKFKVSKTLIIVLNRAVAVLDVSRDPPPVLVRRVQERERAVRPYSLVRW